MLAWHRERRTRGARVLAFVWRSTTLRDVAQHVRPHWGSGGFTLVNVLVKAIISIVGGGEARKLLAPPIDPHRAGSAYSVLLQ
jgi:hypothetical protein